MKIVSLGTAGCLTTLIALASPFAARAQDAEAHIDLVLDASADADGARRLARTQASAGDMSGAASTLERALLREPRTGTDADMLRLEYAALLCRLDDRARAQYQLGNVSNANAPEWERVRAACGDIAIPTAQSPASDGLRGAVWAGLAFDGDAYGQIQNDPFIANTPAARDDGVSFVAGLSLQGRGAAGGRSFVYYGADALTKNSILAGPRVHYQVGSARLGFGTALAERGDFMLGGVIRHARLSDAPYVTEYGGQVSVGIRTTPTTRWSIDGEIVAQDYHGLAFGATRDGTRYDVGIVHRQTPDAGARWVLGAAFEAKDARDRTLAYTGGRAFGAVEWPISDNGSYANLSATVRYLDYRDPSLTVRGDREWRGFLRGAIGIAAGSGWFVEPAVSYTTRIIDSPSPQRDYSSVGAELRLVHRFGG